MGGLLSERDVSTGNSGGDRPEPGGGSNGVSASKRLSSLLSLGSPAGDRGDGMILVERAASLSSRRRFGVATP